MELPLGLYKHYKGALYEVLAIVTHSETLDKLVLYKATYQTEGSNLWVRPIIMFLEILVVNGKEIRRFEKVNE